MLPITQEPGQASSASISNYLAILNRRKWLAISVVAITMGVSALYTLRQAPEYQATTVVAVRSPIGGNPLDPTRGADATRSLQNEIEFIQSDRMDAALDKKLESRADVSVSAAEDADVLEIKGTSSDKAVVAPTANAVAQEYIDLRVTGAVQANDAKIEAINTILLDLAAQIAELSKPLETLDNQIATTPPGPVLDALEESRLRLQSSTQPKIEALVSEQSLNRDRLSTLVLSNQGLQDDAIQVLQKASTPDAPIGPSLLSNLLVAAIVGMVLAVGAVALAEQLDDSIKNKATLDQFKVPVLGVISGVPDWRDSSETKLETLDRPTSATSESYRSLRTSVRFVTTQESVRTIQVTSAMPAEGKSTTVANLAVVLARSGERVLVIDGDLRRPRVEQFFGNDSRIGLTSALLGEVPISEAVQPIAEVPGLFLLPTGPVPPNPSELLGWTRTRDLIETLADEFTIVLVDSPPVLPVTDALVTARICDATIVVARSGQSSRRSLARCMANLALIEANVIGTVLNCQDLESEDYLHGYYGPVRTAAAEKG